MSALFPSCVGLFVGGFTLVCAGSQMNLSGDLWLLPDLEAVWGSPEFSEVSVHEGKSYIFSKMRRRERQGVDHQDLSGALQVPIT